MVPDPPAGDAAELNTRELNTEELKTASKGSKGQKRGRLNYSPEFEAFWNQYKKAPNRAQGGSKAEAYAEYKKLSKDVQEALQGALRAAIMDRAKAERNDGFLAFFPHCCRWLKKGLRRLPGNCHSSPCQTQPPAPSWGSGRRPLLNPPLANDFIP